MLRFEPLPLVLGFPSILVNLLPADEYGLCTSDSAEGCSIPVAVYRTSIPHIQFEFLSVSKTQTYATTYATQEVVLTQL